MKQLFDLGITTIRKAIWAPLGVLAFFVVGKALGAYRMISWLDVPTHILGGVAIAYFFYVAIIESQDIVGDIPFPIQVILVFTSTGTATVLWEFIETGLDIMFSFFLNTDLKRTLVDLFSGLLGGFLFALFLGFTYAMRDKKIRESAPSVAD